MNIGKGIRRLATNTAIAASLLGGAQTLEAQQADVYSKTTADKEAASQEINTFGKMTIPQFGTVTIGHNIQRNWQIKEHEASTQNTLSIGAPLPFGLGQQHYVQLNGDAKWESRITGNRGPIYATAGVGSDGLKHAGVSHGFLEDRGASIGYVSVNENVKGEVAEGWRASAWNLAPNTTPIIGGLFTGARIRGVHDGTLEEGVAVIGKPADAGLAWRLASAHNFESDANWTQLIVGGSTPGYYGLNAADSKFFVKEAQQHTATPMMMGRSPSRYIAGPDAWSVSDRAIALERFSTPDFASMQGTAIVYMTDDVFGQLKGSVDDAGDTGLASVKAGIGTNTSRLLSLLELGYDLRAEKPTVDLVGRVYF